MECKIQLNTAAIVDCPVSAGKSAGKASGESPQKMFGEILLEIRETDGYDAKAQIASKGAFLQMTADGCSQGRTWQETVARAKGKSGLGERPAAVKKSPGKAEEEISGMPEKAKAQGLVTENILLPIAAGLEKAMQTQAENDNEGKGTGVASSVLLRDSTFVFQRGEADKEAPIEALSGKEQKAAGQVKTASQNEPLPAGGNAGPAEKTDLETPGKAKAWKSTTSRAPEFFEAAGGENGPLQSEKSPSILSRLPGLGIEMRQEADAGGGSAIEVSSQAKADEVKRHSLTQNAGSKSEAHAASDSPALKSIYRGVADAGGLAPDRVEDKAACKDEIGTEARQRLKAEGSQLAAKAAGGMSAGEALGGPMKTDPNAIGGKEKAFAGKAVENVDEIAEKIEFAMDRIRENGKNSIRVRLQPEELGSIEIRLAQENGIVKGRILVESDAVKEQLGSLLAEEKLSFIQDGQKPREIEVQVSGRHAGDFRGFGQGGFSFQSGRNSGGFAEFKGQRIDVPMEQAERRRGPAGLDMFA